MRHFLLTICLGTILAGCSASTKYDIDVSCPKALFDGEETIDRVTRNFWCDLGRGKDYFDIRCERESVQIVANTYFCSTHDGKSVRIKVVD